MTSLAEEAAAKAPAIFYDSARWGLIPSGSDALLYWDGRYAPPASEIKRFGRTRRITVLGGAFAAAHAGAIDFEAGNAAYEIKGRLREWAEARKTMDCRARVYCNRSDLPKAHSLVGDLPNVCWWVATLDNKRWTLAEIAANILTEARLRIDPERIWAVQYAGGMTAKYDVSLLMGDW
jgi:hypothetical protein